MVSYSYYSHDVRVSREAEALAQQGMRIDCFCLRERGYAKSSVVNGVNIKRLPLHKYRGGSTVKYATAYALFFLLSFFAVFKYHIKNRYDLIQFHTLPDFIIFTGLIPKIFGAKLLLDMHEIMPEFYMSKFGVKMYHPLIMVLKHLEKISVRFAHAVIVINEPIRRLIIERCKPRLNITIVMNCADDKLFCADGFTNAVEPFDFTLMYHGTLTPIYGLEVAIQAVAMLKNRIPQLKFCIFGDETETNGLKKLAENLDTGRSVVFMGRVPREEIPQYIRGADIGVLPMIRDEFIELSFSNKLAEYVCTKTPVVATRLKSTLEYFPEDAISYFESKDIGGLASRIYELYENPERRRLQAEKAFEHYQDIRWEIMRRRYIELIESLIDS